MLEIKISCRARDFFGGCTVLFWSLKLGVSIKTVHGSRIKTTTERNINKKMLENLI